MEIRIQFKDVTQGIFKDIARNELVLRIQPSEAVYMKLNTKTPGLHTRVLPVEMDLTYKKRFTETNIPEAYEALILDALKGDHSNFVRDDELDVAWKVCIELYDVFRCSIYHVFRSSRHCYTGSRAGTARRLVLFLIYTALVVQRSRKALFKSMVIRELILHSKLHMFKEDPVDEHVPLVYGPLRIFQISNHMIRYHFILSKI